MLWKHSLGAFAAIWALSAMLAVADTQPPILFKDGRFQPDVVKVPANTRFTLVIKNLDSEPSEFESFDLNREKIINPGKEAEIYLGPLKPGNYQFFDDFHPRATGVIRAE